MPPQILGQHSSKQDTSNATDGEYFYRKGGTTVLGVQDEGYVGDTNAVSLDQWHRLLISVDNSGETNTYLDGALVGTHVQGTVDNRWSLDSDVIMFGDNDGDDGLINISTLAIYDRAITTSAAVILGTAGQAVDIENNLILGDTNGDEKVLLDDYEALRDNFGSGSTLIQGDVDFDGDVDQDDFLIIRDQFPLYNNGASLASAIPEPTSLCLIALGTIAMLKRNRK